MPLQVNPALLSSLRAFSTPPPSQLNPSLFAAFTTPPPQFNPALSVATSTSPSPIKPSTINPSLYAAYSSYMLPQLNPALYSFFTTHKPTVPTQLNPSLLYAFTTPSPSTPSQVNPALLYASLTNPYRTMPSLLNPALLQMFTTPAPSMASQFKPVVPYTVTTPMPSAPPTSAVTAQQAFPDSSGTPIPVTLNPGAREDAGTEAGRRLEAIDETSTFEGDSDMMVDLKKLIAKSNYSSRHFMTRKRHMNSTVEEDSMSSTPVTAIEPPVSTELEVGAFETLVETLISAAAALIGLCAGVGFVIVAQRFCNHATSIDEEALLASHSTSVT
eukprot:gnl/TRDRNA2_/TRDRNA2_145104_c0_seq1.p1 gnl/TRDRNA2_/TRDRNA2_145104_c0~~gnl/TRDRNA2_/TRDRNA2_145104_c0_seq1.p1  ORF type:complete len:358 (+),score=18.06 gnl/TRDRNA2_/TRDRNA2_145104_c0_seq1:88-1074(+)